MRARIAPVLADWGQAWRGRRRGRLRSTVLHWVGLGMIAYGIGMWVLPVGIAAGGLALLLIEYLSREG